jgi:hypothetical protein
MCRVLTSNKMTVRYTDSNDEASRKAVHCLTRRSALTRHHPRPQRPDSSSPENLQLHHIRYQVQHEENILSYRSQPRCSRGVGNRQSFPSKCIPLILFPSAPVLTPQHHPIHIPAIPNIPTTPSSHLTSYHIHSIPTNSQLTHCLYAPSYNLSTHQTTTRPPISKRTYPHSNNPIPARTSETP